MTVSLDVTLKTTEQNLVLVVHISKSEAEITNKEDCARGIGIVLLKPQRDTKHRAASATAEHVAYQPINNVLFAAGFRQQFLDCVFWLCFYVHLFFLSFISALFLV